MAKKMSMHSGRCGSMKHNYLERISHHENYNDSHINRNMSQYNLFINNGTPSEKTPTYEKFIFRDLKEKNVDVIKECINSYAEVYQKGLDATNQNYINQRHSEKCKTIEDWYSSKGNQNRETIIQLGNHEDFKDLSPNELVKKAAELSRIIEDVTKEMCAQYGDNYKVFGWQIHLDEIKEGSIHAHMQDNFAYFDEKKQAYVPNQKKALEQMGVELPNPSQKESRYNCRIKTFTAQQRTLFIEKAREYGYELDIYEPQLTESKDNTITHKNTKHIEELEIKAPELEAQVQELDNQRQELQNQNIQLHQQKLQLEQELQEMQAVQQETQTLLQQAQKAEEYYIDHLEQIQDYQKNQNKIFIFYEHLIQSGRIIAEKVAETKGLIVSVLKDFVGISREYQIENTNEYGVNLYIPNKEKAVTMIPAQTKRTFERNDGENEELLQAIQNKTLVIQERAMVKEKTHHMHH